MRVKFHTMWRDIPSGREVNLTLDEYCLASPYCVILDKPVKESVAIDTSGDVVVEEKKSGKTRRI